MVCIHSSQHTETHAWLLTRNPVVWCHGRKWLQYLYWVVFRHEVNQGELAAHIFVIPVGSEPSSSLKSPMHMMSWGKPGREGLQVDWIKDVRSFLKCFRGLGSATCRILNALSCWACAEYVPVSWLCLAQTW
jgi:hypothetical protein